jgi:hypothetical protein
VMAIRGTLGVTSMVRKGDVGEGLEEFRIAVADLDPAGRGDWWVGGASRSVQVSSFLESREAERCADVSARNKIPVSTPRRACRLSS